MDKQNLIDLLAKFEIPFWTFGNNVSEDTVNVKCPFCDDHSNHCGVFYKDSLFNCWRCSSRGSIGYLLSRLINLSREECDRLVGSDIVSFKESAVQTIEKLIKPQEIVKGSDPVEIGLPQYFEPVIENIDFPLLYAYLKRRKLKVETLIQYGCGICRVGKLMNRLIIPIIYQNRVVSYQAADMSGRGEVKYKTADNEINNYLYNLDNWYGPGMIVCEGILDCWAVENGAVATFGTHLTNRQRELILSKNVKELIFCWDSDAFWKAREQAEYFKPFIESVKTVCLPKPEDPDSLGHDRIWEYITETV